MAKPQAQPRTQSEVPAMPRDDERQQTTALDANARHALEQEVAPPDATPLQMGGAVASVKVLTGINAGVSMPLTKAQTTIGRPGVQVAAILKNGDAFVLKGIEGKHAPVVNNQPVPGDGAELAHGDVIELAGRKIEFVRAESGRRAVDSKALPASDEASA
jgi:hypothetical protein